MPFKLSKEAVNDLRKIGAYTQKEWGKKQRRIYLENLNKKFKTLADAPLVYRERTEFTPPVRLHHHEKHYIIYLAEPDHILIVRVLHESMALAAHLSEEGRA